MMSQMGPAYFWALPTVPIRALLLSLLLLPVLLAAQSDTTRSRFFESYAGGSAAVVADTPSTTVLPGEVSIHAEPKVERLMERYNEERLPRKGFRVQIYLGERKSAEETKRTFLQKNPDTPAYLSWLAPNWRLRVGDCRTRLEAERMLRDLRAAYPGSYIVPDEIEMPVIITSK